MDKPIFILDCDGCLASQGKIWFEGTEKVADPFDESGVDKKVLGVYKQISDHDSWAIDAVKDKAHILILSGDKRINEMWAKRRGVDFLFTATDGFHTDKWAHLTKWFEDKFGGQKYPDFFYLGDAPPDLSCMRRAKIAFMPADACAYMDRLRRTGHIGECYKLKAESGRGCFEEMLDFLIGMEVVPELRV